MSQFVHLNVHSEYSMVDGIVRIKPLMEALKSEQIPAVAITDLNNLFAAVKLYKAALSKGIKPIFGAEMRIHNPAEPVNPYSLILLCLNHQGYKNLLYLVSQAYLKASEEGRNEIKREWLVERNEGLIVLSGGMNGVFTQAVLDDKTGACEKEITFWQTHFQDRFYLEIARVGQGDEEHYIKKIVQISEEYQVPIVATNKVCFLDVDDYDAHEARVCIHDGYVLEDDKRPKTHTNEQYLKSPEEMISLFHDIPEAIHNTVEIAKRCNVYLTLGENFLPNFPIPSNTTMGAYLKQTSQEGLNKRLAHLFPEIKESELAEKRKPYDERLLLEIDVIENMGFSGYFLIVADFIQWAKDNGVPVGPGRGSGAGSLVAYVLGITDLDPLAYDLLFERFLNPERVSMPDFDVDFCMEGRDRVIDYVAQKYGKDSVSQIITFGTMAAKAVVRDVGRVLGHPYGFVDKIAKLIPFEIGMTLDKALEQEELLRERYDAESEVTELLNLAKKLEGITRNAGKHAGGVVIAPSELTDFTAIYCEPGSTQIVSQFDKDDVEAVGLVKFDFLGLRTLTIINWALQSIQSRLNKSIDISLIPTDDKKAFDLLKACKTTAVFQLESRGMKELIHRLQPDCFEDIVALVALFRPGPLQSGMVDDFIDRKRGRAKVIYPHDKLEPILKPTYGVILYQEQVMQIAQVLAGYSLGAADLLRRAMGKKKPEEMAKQRVIFTEGAIKNGIEEKTATYIFDLMEKFAGYGFNKSHSAAYALIAYQTAWLKAHYKSSFMASVLSSDMDNTDKVVIFIDECKEENIEILAPSINESYYQFVAISDQDIRYGLGAIKGVGESAIESIILERKNGRFNSLFDLCHRMSGKKINRRILEALIKSGALDEFSENRASLFASIDKALQLSDFKHKNLKRGQQDLFDADSNEEETYLDVPAWSSREALYFEKEVLGLFFSAHPISSYMDEINAYRSSTIAKLMTLGKKSAIIVGLITAVRKVMTKRGKKMLIVSLDDMTARIDIAVFEEQIEQYHPYLKKDEIVVVEGELSKDNYTGGMKMSCKTAYSIETARAHFFKHMKITLTSNDQNKLPAIKSLLETQKGEVPVMMEYHHVKGKVNVSLGKAFSIIPNDELLSSLSTLLDHKPELINE